MKNPKQIPDNKEKTAVNADTLGNTRISLPILDNIIHPDAAPLHQIPVDKEVEVALSRIENLIFKGHFGAALKEAKALKIDNSPLAAHYEFIQHEKISRANIGIGDRYFILGDKENARKFYENAVKPETANATIIGIAGLANQTFDQLLKKRQGLFDDLKNCIKNDSFTDWCGKKNNIRTITIADAGEIRAKIFPDFTLEGVFGERPPIVPTPGWVDPLPPEADFIDFPSVTPGAAFNADTENAISVDVSIPKFSQARTEVPSAGASSSFEPTKDNRIRASVAMPIIANVLTAKVRLFALDQGLTLTGQAQGGVPLFRYEYLRDRAKEIITHIQDIESRMLPIQFKLDDFAEAVAPIRLQLTEQQAELDAANRKIDGLMKNLAALSQTENEVNKIVIYLDPIQNQCDCDWFCWVRVAFDEIIIGSFIFGLAAAIVASGGVAAVVLGLLGEAGLVALADIVLIKEVSCDNIGDIIHNFETILTATHQAIQENDAELNYQLALRDIIIANINALNHELSEVYASNAVRVLNNDTLNLIQQQYDTLRQSLFSRAQSIAKQAEDAFNFEQDSDVHLIKDSYADGLNQDKKGYTHAETLLRDLEGLDYIDITGRTQKAMQLSQVVSLRKHYPISFPSILTLGRARFIAKMEDFDRWFPGTYMQRIKEVRVEVLVDGQAMPARGYISNDGISFIRFSDPGNKVEVDNIHIFPEPDTDISQLCYKRFQRRRHVDTMAFPDFDSYLHEDRMRKLQDNEHNFFEDIGPESTWLIELLPDQPFDFSRITDVKVFFQYEAFYDENLKRILEQKRYVERRESVGLSVKKLLERDGKVADFSDTITINVLRGLFEAPAIDKQIRDVGFVVKPEGLTPLSGVARLEVSFQGAAPIQVATNDRGVVATAPDHPAGTGLADLEAIARGKNIDGIWTIKILELPGGLGTDAIDDISLMLNYEYQP